MEEKITVVNFSNVYKEEKFYENEHVEWVDCSDIAGVDCFCDNGAAMQIVRRLRSLSAKGLHFIDSGNYHYVSKFFTDKIKQHFSLVVFDHHPDMQPSLFDQILTCGDWVKAVLDTNRFADKVVLVGTSDKLLQNISADYADRIVTFPESQLGDRQAWRTFYDMHFNTPIYVSIDKDVLSPVFESTNWDQGVATLPQLKRLLVTLLRHNRLIGVDVCGECSYSIRGLLDGDVQKDDMVNSELLRLLSHAESSFSHPCD